MTKDFVARLGECLLASSIDVVFRPLLSLSSSALKVKYVAAFLYQGYIILAKVKKNQTYVPWHWLSLKGSRVERTADDRE